MAIVLRMRQSMATALIPGRGLNFLFSSNKEKSAWEVGVGIRLELLRVEGYERPRLILVCTAQQSEISVAS